jgi:hypothetical protein
VVKKMLKAMSICSLNSRGLINTLLGGSSDCSIISFRNILAHGYDSIDHRIVWDIIEEDLGKLLEDVQRLLEEDKEEEDLTNH